MKVVGLASSENFFWTDDVKYRVSKTIKSLSPATTIASKVHLCRAILSSALCFPSECWELGDLNIIS